MLTDGQVGRLGSEDGDGAVTAVVAGCEFEPKSWLNRSPSEGLPPADCELPNMLPPPHPESMSAVIASVARRNEGRLARATALSLERKSSMMQMSPDEFRWLAAMPKGSSVPAQWQAGPFIAV
jgi:hypothetical protein